MAVETSWKQTLMPFADKYAELLSDIELECRSLDDETLATLEQQASMPTQTNCWWATYHVAHLVKHEAEAEIYRRKGRA